MSVSGDQILYVGEKEGDDLDAYLLKTRQGIESSLNGEPGKAPIFKADLKKILAAIPEASASSP